MVKLNAQLQTLAMAMLLVDAWSARSQTDTIRVYCVGSSSFSEELIIATKYIVEASGDYVLEYAGSDYTRLDDFARGITSYSDWLAENMPRLQAGNYDYVIAQTINFAYLNPAEHDTLFQGIIPDLAQRVRSVGAGLVLYDKWPGYGCYPQHVYNNHLFHIEAGVRAGVTKVAFVAGAVWELWADDYFDDDMGFLYVGGNNGGGHPGAMVNYMSACNLSYHLTGISPIGNTVRRVKLQRWEMESWAALADDHPLKSHVVDSHLVLTEWEADTLQRTAFRWCTEWTTRLLANTNDPATFTATMVEIDDIEAAFGNYRDWYTADWIIQQLDERCSAPSSPLTAEELQQIRDDTRLFTARVEHYARLYLDSAAYLQFVQDYLDYWLHNNSKLRDDVYYQSLIAQAVAEKEGDAAEATRLQHENTVFLEVLSLAAEDLLLERITDAQRQEFLGTFVWTGVNSTYAPLFGEAQVDATADRHELVAAREVYFGVWENVNLMDELKDSGFSLDVWLEADARFASAHNGTPVARHRIRGAQTTAARPVCVLPSGLTLRPAHTGVAFTARVIDPAGRTVATLVGTGQVLWAWPDNTPDGMYVVDYRSGATHKSIPHMHVQ